MNDDVENNGVALGGKTSTGHWIASGLLFVWSLFGVMAYLGAVGTTPEMLAAGVASGEYTQGYADLLGDIPAWHMALFAIAVFSAVLGAICLLLRKKWAVLLYTLSLACIAISFIKTFVMDKAASLMSGGQIAIEIAILAIALIALWYVRRCAGRGQLN